MSVSDQMLPTVLHKYGLPPRLEAAKVLASQIGSLISIWDTSNGCSTENDAGNSLLSKQMSGASFAAIMLVSV